MMLNGLIDSFLSQLESVGLKGLYQNQTTHVFTVQKVVSNNA